MNEQVLYRKYRPSSFKDVRGQDHIVTVLEQALKNGGISHAYLFSGTRGTGKTSIARILAREIGTQEEDIYEIDAASHTSVDDVREINEGVNSLPYRSPKKVYIIDEVHMLSKSAFNALLKTLEEPPEHVIFMLATTEMHKLPDTVISRCEVHRFKKPTQSELTKLIHDVAKSEGFTVDKEGAVLTALLGDGSYRDTLGMLQKVLRSVKGKKISHEDIERITGAPSLSILNGVIEALDESDVNKALSAVGKAVEQNIDMSVFLTLLLDRVRTLLLIRYAPDLRKMIEGEIGKEDFEYLSKIAGNKESDINSDVLRELLQAFAQVKFAALPHLPIELALMRIMENKENSQD